VPTSPGYLTILVLNVKLFAILKSLPLAGLTGDKVQLRNLQDLCFVHPGLEGKVEVRKEFALRKPGFFDSSLDPSFDSGICFDGQQPFKDLGRWKRLLCGTGKFLVKDLLYSQKLQGLEMVSDSGQGLLRHGLGPL